MSILRTLNTGATGLSAHGEALGVVGDNIANANTIGFKRSRGQFLDMLGGISGQTSMPQVGGGTRLAHVQQMWQQGALLGTERPTDLALSGSGFFMVEGNVNGMVGNFFTRAGQFEIDNEGYLVTTDKLRLQGYMADGRGQVGGALTDLRIVPTTLPATPSENVQMRVNLDANAATLPGFDPLDPAGSSNFSNSVTVYDSLGNAHEITTYFTKVADNTWEWHAMVDGAELVGGVPGEPTEGASGTLTFTTNGELDAETMGASSWDFVGATAGQVISFDFGESLAEGGTGLTGSTQFGEPSTTSAASQDGYGAGTVSGISVSSDGVITGVFSNGQQRTLGQVAVADFRNVDGLSRAGQGLWRQTQESGEALLGTPGSGGRGAVVAGALEQSNVDMGREFVDLIAYQRGFQANSKIVQTADEVYGELVNLRR
jgi:flagellar hook protein FlgE